MNDTHILFDSDFVIALLIETQSTHDEAKKIFRQIKQSQCFILNIVFYELLTVMSKKWSYEVCLNTFQIIQSSSLQIIPFDGINEPSILEEFFSHKKKNISFVDCANLTYAKNHNYKIASFDKFYPSKYLV